MNTKFQTAVLAAAALLLTTAAYAQVTLTDIGSTAPTPGANDISQLTTSFALGSGNNPPGLNYYWDEGAGHPTGPGYIGQTFTTSNNPNGYTLTSLAIRTGGNGGGSEFQSQSFTLSIYQLSGTGLANATLLAAFTATSALGSEGDWMQWTGLGVNLAPNTNYAYGFGRSPGSPGDWECLATATNLPYSGGQACEIVNAGGKVTYSSSVSNYDATFDLGITLPSAPIPAPPLESPAGAYLALLAGTNVTLTAASAGETPISYQWQTDGGSGLGPTNIPGAISTNLVVNTTGWANGTYVYDYVAANVLGTNTSSYANIVITNVFMADIGSNAPTPGPVDISQLLSTLQTDDGFNYYTDDGAGHGAWAGQTFTTGTNRNGYVMNSLAWKSAGNGSAFPATQLYDLFIYSITEGGTNANLLTWYQTYGGGTEQDWLKWVGLNVPLAPNALYAYAFGRDTNSSGWEHIADQGGNPYAGGQLCTIFPSSGGMVTYGTTGNSDATFDIGLAVSELPLPSQPTYTPNVNPVYAGTTVTLLESAVGSPPLFYQWLADNGTGGGTWTPTGVTTSNLVVDTTSLTANNYEYEVIVSNAFGSATSAVQTLNVVAANVPIIVTDTTPTNLNEGFVGETITFSATFAGTLPISYQWVVDTGGGATPISSASNPSAISNTLVLANLQLSNAGTYSLTTSNSVGGPVPSTPSTLVVFPDPAAPASGSFGAMILSNSPVAFWQLNETEDPSTGVTPAYDASGNNYDGLYGLYAQNYYNGALGPENPPFPGFPAVNGALATLNDSPDEYVTVPPLNLNTNAVTIAMWINPSDNQIASEGLFVNRNAGNTDAAGLSFGGTLNSTGMAELGYVWNTNGAATYDFNSGLYPLVNQWSFVALVIQPSQATIYLYYIDPITLLPDLYSAVNPIPHGVEKFSGGTTVIGSDLFNLLTRSFNGAIADVAVYNKSLSGDQILALFSKAANIGQVAASISEQPQSAGVYAGATASFTAGGINGTSPFNYQWQFNGANLTNGGNISGVNSLSLIISNATAADAGTYSLFVTNPVGVTPSSNATLTVVTPVPGSFESAVLQYGPLAFWRLNETNSVPGSGGVAYDYVSGLDGVYQAGAQNGYMGIPGPSSSEFPGFPANNWALATFDGLAASYVTASAGALIATNLTYVMWINPSNNAENWAGLLMDRGAVGEGLGFGGDNNAGGQSDLGYTWNQNSTWSFSTYLFPPTNQWSLVAMVIEPSQGAVYLINSSGVQSAVNAIPHDSEEFAVAWHIGDDAQGGTAGGRTFPGSISSVAVYLSALSAYDLTALYNVGVGAAPPSVSLNLAAAGSGTNLGLTLSWSHGTLLQSSNLLQWTTNTAASPYTVAPANSQMFFKVRVQ